MMVVAVITVIYGGGDGDGGMNVMFIVFNQNSSSLRHGLIGFASLNFRLWLIIRRQE